MPDVAPDDEDFDEEVIPNAYILHALPEEVAHLTLVRGKLKVFVVDGRKSLVETDGLPLEHSYDVPPSCYSVTFCVGVGKKNAEANTRMLLSGNIIIPCILIVGFAGGLVDGLTPGTLVIGDSVTDSSDTVLTADSRLLAIAESVRLPELAAMRGTIYTDNKVLTQSMEKRALAQSRDVIAVDMETFAAAQVAQKAGVSWLAIRAVTDGAADDLPFDFNAMMDADGNVSKGRVIASALTHPWTIPALIRLGTRSSLAAKNLARFLEAYLPLLSDVNI